jgi:hypothetical protein
MKTNTGRPKKKSDYNPEEIANTLTEALTESYLNPEPGEESPDDPKHCQLEVLAEEFSMTRIKVRKLLITAGSFETPISRENPLQKSRKQQD